MSFKTPYRASLMFQSIPTPYTNKQQKYLRYLAPAAGGGLSVKDGIGAYSGLES